MQHTQQRRRSRHSRRLQPSSTPWVSNAKVTDDASLQHSALACVKSAVSFWPVVYLCRHTLVADNRSTAHVAGAPVLVAQLSAGGGDGQPGRVYLSPDAMHAERISAGQLLAVRSTLRLFSNRPGLHIFGVKGYELVRQIVKTVEKSMLWRMRQVGAAHVVAGAAATAAPTPLPLTPMFGIPPPPQQRLDPGAYVLLSIRTTLEDQHGVCIDGNEVRGHQALLPKCCTPLQPAQSTCTIVSWRVVSSDGMLLRYHNPVTAMAWLSSSLSVGAACRRRSMETMLPSPRRGLARSCQVPPHPCHQM
jgi:hypothetical protein